MKVTVVYIAVSLGPDTFDHCSRFVGSWMACPPGVDCDLIVACNGGPLPMETAILFQPLNAMFYPRANDVGWDISAYQDVARKVTTPIVCCLGESCYAWKQNWLMPMVEAFNRFGEGVYGFFSSYMVRPHLNTSGFVTAPRLLKGHPTVTTNHERYHFEHGVNSFWRRLQRFNKPTKLVTADGVYDPPQWRSPDNIMWRGDQSNCLIRCNHMDRWDAASEEDKVRWSYNADRKIRE